MHVENVQRQRDIDGELNEVRAQISAVNNTKHDGDWVYESCRIATTLWAAATSQKVPLMEAAASLERKSVMEAPITKLVHAIKQTDISTCWDNMAGVLLWMTMIGGAAAKEQEEKSYLLAVSVRCIIVLMGEHKYALVDSMMKLLKVMQLWTDGRL